MGIAPERLNRIKGLPFFGLGGYYTTGNIFWVDSGHPAASDNTSNGGSPDLPFATIDYAIGQCTASNGDVIYVMPGHTSTVTAAGGITADVAGVSIVGLGCGSNRPTINFTTATTADIDITAANVSFDNIVFDITGVDTVAKGLHIVGANCTIKNCEFVVADSGGQATLAILTSAAATNLYIKDCRFLGSADAGTTAAVSLVGTDGTRIHDCFFYGAYTATVGGIQGTGTANTRLDIARCVIQNITANSTVCVDLMAASTGIVRDCRFSVTTDGGKAAVDTMGDAVQSENYVSNAIAETGIINGTVST